MVVVTYIVLAWLGLAFGSFINALVWRLHEQGAGFDKPKKFAKTKKTAKKVNVSVINGRSVCESCGHQLAWYDLAPVLSWLWLRGKCRYCHKPISVQNPLVEVGLALVFTLSYAFWPAAVSGWQWVMFVTWLAASIGLMALLVYDTRYMLLPNRIIYPTLAVAVAGRVAFLIGYQPDKLRAVAWWTLGIVVASGVFWLLYMLSRGKLIGYGDVRLGLVTGTLLATPARSFLMIFLASVIGVIFILPALAAGKKSMASRVPYGPFLITATAVTVLFGTSILDWYRRIFLP